MCGLHPGEGVRVEGGGDACLLLIFAYFCAFGCEGMGAARLNLALLLSLKEES